MPRPATRTSTGIAFVPVGLMLVACTPAPETIGGGGSENGDSTAASATSAGPTTSESDAESADVQSTGSTGSIGPVVRIRVRASADPFAHDDAWSGQTPRKYYAGFRSLTLVDTTETYPPLVVFDLGTGHVEAGYNDGDDTLVAEVPASTLDYGAFDRARIVLTHMRFEVDATVHAAGQHVPGVVDAVQVLSDATVIEGQPRDQGWWQYVFRYGELEFPSGGNTGAPVQMPPPGAPVEVVVEGPETAVYFSVSVLVDPTVDNDVDVIVEANVHESFRWEDQVGTGFEDGIFDAEVPAFEPIRHLGVNSYTLLYQ